MDNIEHMDEEELYSEDKKQPSKPTKSDGNLDKKQPSKPTKSDGNLKDSDIPEIKFMSFGTDNPDDTLRPLLDFGEFLLFNYSPIYSCLYHPSHFLSIRTLSQDHQRNIEANEIKRQRCRVPNQIGSW